MSQRTLTFGNPPGAWREGEQDQRWIDLNAMMTELYAALAAPIYANGVAIPNLSTQQDNFNPSGNTLGFTNYYDLPLTANVTFTGWAAPGVDGFTIVLWNGTTFAAQFTDHDSSSLTPNQFACPNAAPNMLGPMRGALLRYNATLSKWTFLS